MQVVRECSDLVPDHPFSKAVKSIRTVEATFTREEGHEYPARLGKPKDAEQWQWLNQSLNDANREINAFISNEDARRDVREAEMKNFAELERYLRKFTSIFNGIHDLVRATVSLKNRHLLLQMQPRAP